MLTCPRRGRMLQGPRQNTQDLSLSHVITEKLPVHHTHTQHLLTVRPAVASAPLGGSTELTKPIRHEELSFTTVYTRKIVKNCPVSRARQGCSGDAKKHMKNIFCCPSWRLTGKLHPLDLPKQPRNQEPLPILRSGGTAQDGGAQTHARRGWWVGF